MTTPPVRKVIRRSEHITLEKDTDLMMGFCKTLTTDIAGIRRSVWDMSAISSANTAANSAIWLESAPFRYGVQRSRRLDQPRLTPHQPDDGDQMAKLNASLHI